MKYLKIRNNGLLDIRLIALMGGTTKANDSYKIGQFGTGLKYTLAYLLRNNIDFHIFSGNEKANITIEHETIHEQIFNIICINGNRTSITDKMGMEWSAWMIIRELWCNALDEGGSFKEVTETIQPEENCTCFYIQITAEFKAVIDSWNKYFVHEIAPIFSNEDLAVYPGGESLRIYKNGVLVKEVPNEKSLYSYDLKNISINEMREFNGSKDYVMYQCLNKVDSKTATHFLEAIDEKYFEAKANWDWYEKFGEGWKEAIGEAKIIHPEALRTIQERGIQVDIARAIIVPENIYKALTKQFKGIGMLRAADKVNEFYETYSSDSDSKIKQALVILEDANYNFSPEIKFVFGVFGDKNIWAQINKDTKEVFISENIADKSLFDVCTTLIEENEHLKSGFSDCSRPFQQHFIDLYTNQLFKNAKITL